MNSFNEQYQKKKVVFIMGSTGSGKSRLSIDLAIHFQSEIINSDKIQVYKGLDITTNKVPASEQQGVPHHLLGDFDPNSDFTANDFCHHALSAVERILESERVPIIVGGSNTYIEALVEDPSINFRSKYDCCFIWLDVSLPILYSFVSKRVDQMVHAGLVDEVRGIFVPDADYTRGIRRAIGVPEMDEYFQAEMNDDDDKEKRDKLLDAAIEEIKANTCKLASCQRGKIERLRNELGWLMHRIDATIVFEKRGEKGESNKEVEVAWENFVKKPCLEIVADFLKENEKVIALEALLSNSMVLKEEEKVVAPEILISNPMALKEDEKVVAPEILISNAMALKEDEKVAAPEKNLISNPMAQPSEGLQVGT